MTQQNKLNKTKIVCTIGPSVFAKEQLQNLMQAGMNVARLNFSHGSHEQHAETITHIRQLSEENKLPIAILQDLSGPKLRIGTFAEDAVHQLVKGAEFSFFGKPMEGDENGVSFPYPQVFDDLKPGHTILVADGAIQLGVIRVIGREKVITEVLNDGQISSHKGVNFPDSRLGIPALTQKDKQDLEFGIKMGVDYIALSFVRNAEDLHALRNVLGFFDRDIPLIAKIEKHEAVDNLDAIAAEADGLMVARGDLGVEVPLEKVPRIQKQIIRTANLMGKPVITATQMLRSMVDNPRPTRAEVTDVANAIWDGTDAVMLSEETAVGNYPIKAVETLVEIAVETETAMNLLDKRHSPIPEMLNYSIRDAIATGVHYLTEKLSAKVILTPTITGTTPKLISRLQPSAPIVAFTPHESTYRRLALSWGVFPYLSVHQPDFKSLIEMALDEAANLGWIKKGEMAIIALGYPPGEERTDTIKVVAYGDQVEA
jgi:pyruvate kinase